MNWKFWLFVTAILASSLHAQNRGPVPRVFYAYCLAQDYGHTTYYSAIFPIPDTREKPSIDEMQHAFGRYLKAQFERAPDVGVCFTQKYLTREQAEEAKAHTENTLANQLGHQKQGPPTETGWTPGTALPAVASTPAAPAPRPALPTTSEPLVYTYCFFGQNTRTYVSAVFQLHGQEPGMSTPQYRRILSDAYETPFQKYLDREYNVPTTRPSSHGCHDGFATRALAEANRAAYVGLANNASKGLTAIETPWQGTDATGLPLKAKEDAPDQASRDLNTYIERERPTLEPACQSSGMSHLMDCSCVAETIHAARVAGPTTLVGMHLSPQVGILKMNLNFGSCTSAQRIAQYATERVESTYRNPEMRVPLEPCVPRKMVVQILANPASLTHTEAIDRFFLTDVNACRSGK